MNARGYILVAFLLILPVGCRTGTQGESYTRAGYDFSDIDVIAVVDVNGVIESEAIKNQIAEFFSKQLLRRGYGPIERQQVQYLLSQANLQNGGRKGDAYAIEAGRALNYPIVLAIYIPVFGDEISITAKLLEVEHGSTLWVGSGSLTRLGSAWWSFGQGTESTGLTGNIFAANQGPYVDQQQQAARQRQAAATRALTVRQARQVEGLVKRICQSLPYKHAELQPKGGFLKAPRIGS
ncbi:MAG: hypothetical protein QHH07_00840 [Sedimentisphaerales bacterium]|jgi:hypothetical protein|nr:hypothetical protein [Sedimentisphaerales bacterium]